MPTTDGSAESLYVQGSTGRLAQGLGWVIVWRGKWPSRSLDRAGHFFSSCPAPTSPVTPLRPFLVRRQTCLEKAWILTSLQEVTAGLDGPAQFWSCPGLCLLLRLIPSRVRL